MYLRTTDYKEKMNIHVQKCFNYLVLKLQNALQTDKKAKYSTINGNI